MNLLTKITKIRDFYGYSTSYFMNMVLAIEKAELNSEYKVTNVNVCKLMSKQEPIIWSIEHLLGEYYYDTKKPFDFELIS